MRAATLALLAAALFFAGVLVGGVSQSGPTAAVPAPVVLTQSASTPSPELSPTPGPASSVEEVEHDVEESDLDDNSGHGNAEDREDREARDDNSGPENREHDTDNSGSGSGSSDGGSSGSGGDDSSGPGQ